MSDAAAPSPPARPAAASRPALLLPPSPSSDRPLLLVIAVIIGLACTAAIAARSAWSAADAWTAALEGAMTVQVRAVGDERAEDAAARAAAAIADVPGVASAAALSRADIERLLAPWFGDGGAPADAPLPGLVDVRLDPSAPAEPDAILAALTGLQLAAAVDDHGRWARDIRRAAGVARILALAILTALLAAAVAVTSFATRASLSSRADVVDVLHLVGATDAFIASEFTRRFLQLGLRGGLLGAALAAAAAVAAVLLSQGGADDFVPRFRFAGGDAIILALAPLMSAAVAAVTARATVRAALARLY